jgi:signal transduction histidine kinase
MVWQQSPLIPLLIAAGLFSLGTAVFALRWYYTKRKEIELLLRQANEAAETAERAKTQFLTNMSHEIRTPLNAVVGMTEMLRQTPLNANQSELLNAVATSSNNLMLLINNILDLAKLEAGNFTLNHQSFDLNDCLESAIDNISQAANQKQLQFTYNLDEKTPVWLVGDPVRLRQILINLLENSVKFTEEGKVELFVTHNLEGEQVQLQFTVQDSGIGIDAEQIEHLFSPFQQADGSMTRAYGGSGLGLVICKRLVEIMGGHIYLQSEPGQGTAVHFTTLFSVATEAHPPAVTLRQPGATLAHKRLLIITKDASERRQINKEARLAGLEVYAAASIQEATYWINNSQPFDVVLLDAAIWQEDISVLAQLHRKDSFHPLPTILLVPQGEEQLTTANLFSDTLLMPIARSQLYDVLLNVLFTSEANVLSALLAKLFCKCKA